MVLASGGIFASFSSRKTIFEQIMRWRRPPVSVSPAGRALPRARRWRVRGNFLLLVTPDRGRRRRGSLGYGLCLTLPFWCLPASCPEGAPAVAIREGLVKAADPASTAP
jgi:hypothetical protein